MYEFESIYYTLYNFYVFNEVITKLNPAFLMKHPMYIIYECYNYSVCVESEEVNKIKDNQKLKKNQKLNVKINNSFKETTTNRKV